MKLTYSQPLPGVQGPLTADQERVLGWKILNENSESARLALIQANLYLVASIARQYAGRMMSCTELMERGTIGLERAVETYDPAQGLRFSTHASWWIKSAIREVRTRNAHLVRASA